MRCCYFQFQRFLMCNFTSMAQKVEEMRNSNCCDMWSRANMHYISQHMHKDVRYIYDFRVFFFHTPPTTTRRMRPFNDKPCDFFSTHETFVIRAASLNRERRYGCREYLMGRLVSVTGQGQVIFLLCGDHSDGDAETNCECVQNGGIAFISINKETFYLQIFVFFSPPRRIFLYTPCD